MNIKAIRIESDEIKWCLKHMADCWEMRTLRDSLFSRLEYLNHYVSKTELLALLKPESVIRIQVGVCESLNWLVRVSVDEVRSLAEEDWDDTVYYITTKPDGTIILGGIRQ